VPVEGFVATTQSTKTQAAVPLGVLRSLHAQRSFSEEMTGIGEESAASGWGRYVRVATQYATSSGQTEASSRESGSRRRRLAGVLQAANDFRQSYYATKSTNSSAEEWPEIGPAHTDDEELLLFPSYARMIPPEEREKNFTQTHDCQLLDETIPGSTDISEKKQNNASDDNVVDVDVHGWLFRPHSGPLGRKNRMSIWIARQLCGLPALAPGLPSTVDGNPTPEEAEAARHAASAIANSTNSSLEKKQTPLRASETQETGSEVQAAQTAFEQRLAPFTHLPISNTPVTIFFFNDKTSQSRTLLTSENGHFFVRASLPFVPTQARVLASDKLSATEELVIYKTEGVSLISDIDDTVKHSGITLGAREMFKNTFTAPIENFIIPGVSDWYRTLADPPYNVPIHYISNSPWQLFPLLSTFFRKAALPPGSFHLKQYSGMLQGIFEPTAERKKGTIERVVKDFPNRKWILVGDSGESDLEIYTEVAQRWPDRVLAICIRDVRTITNTGFFDSSSVMSFEFNSKQGSENRNPQMPINSLVRTTSLPPRPVIIRNNPIGSSLINSASTLSLNIIPNTPPPLPQKPINLRSPPIPRKPEHLQSSASTSAQNNGLPHTYPPVPDTPPLPPRKPTYYDPLRTTASPMLSEKPSSMDSGNADNDFPGPEQILSKKDTEWMRRWGVALTKLEGKNVRLLPWRVGADVKDVIVDIVARELGVKRETRRVE
jgi:phosphatidate phosphatase APP1